MDLGLGFPLGTNEDEVEDEGLGLVARDRVRVTFRGKCGFKLWLH